MEEKMKKKIALFLVAALISVGLVISCGGNDTKKPESTTTGPWKVTFNPDGGTFDDDDSTAVRTVEVEDGKTVGAAKWSDATKGDEVFDGWFDGTTEYKSDSKITKDVNLKAKYSPRPEYALDLGGFTWLNNENQKGWRANGTDNTVTDLPIEELRNAKYLVLHTKGGNSDTAFGDISVIVQSNGESGWPWNSTNIGGADFDRTKDNFIVIDISKIKGGSALSLCSQGKFIIQYYGSNMRMNLGLGLEAGYITNKNLSAKPADAVEFKATVDGEEVVYGFVTGDNILGITIPTTFYTVTFNADGGSPAVADVKVGEGKSLGVKYPTWVTKDGYDFLGWLYRVTEYTASTSITADITLKAVWEEVPLPTFNSAADITFVGKTNIGSNAIGIGSGEYGNGEFDISLFTDSKYLVLAFLGSNSNRDGFGGIQVAIQSSVAPSDWNNNSSPDWTSFANKANEFVFVVVKLENMAKYNEISTNSSLTGAKFVLNWGFTNYKGAWLTSEDLDTDEFTASGTTGVFYITKTLGIE